MSWWRWVLLIAVLLILLLDQARRSWQRMIRQEALAALKREYPEMSLVSESRYALVLKIEDQDVTVNLHNLYRMCAQCPTPEARQEVYASFFSGLKDIVAGKGPLSLEACRDRIMPRVVPLEFLANLPATVGSLPHKPFAEGIDLAIVYVIDSPNAVSYLTEKQLAELGLDLDALHALAMANLEKVSPAKAVREVLENKTLVVIKTLDDHDATRILLVPACLPEDAGIAAMIPDTDTLVLAPVPADGDWSRLRKLAAKAYGKKVYGRPLLVTKAGFAPR
ncbi:MAG: hypothetical protein K6U03_06455 [Firmicutes bacterium]|nr:hypothetical protein [Bacillota bacterium]